MIFDKKIIKYHLLRLGIKPITKKQKEFDDFYKKEITFKSLDDKKEEQQIKKLLRLRFTQIKTRCRQTNRIFTVTPETLLDIFNKQEGLCYYSKFPIQINGHVNSNPFLLSVERLDSSKGYTHDNVVLCCFGANCMKNAYSIEDFYRFVETIYNNKPSHINQI